MSSERSTLPRIGVGVLVTKGNEILLGLRKGSHGSGLWASPGGDLEYGEELEACARRELKEECGEALRTKNWRLAMLANFPGYTPHYLMVGFACDYAGGEAINCEPEKKECWKWWPMDGLPANTLGGTTTMLEALKHKQFFFEIPHIR